MPIIDITWPLSNDTVVWPGDPSVAIGHDAQISQGDRYHTSTIRFGSHSGTHIDAPRHLVSNGAAVSDIPLDWLIGPCTVIETSAAPLITQKDLSGLNLKNCSRLLIKTSNTEKLKSHAALFLEDFIALDASAADWLINAGIRLIGIDYMSIENPKYSPELTVHKKLLSRNIVILENVDLSQVLPGEYELMVLPLKILHADGAPVRAVLRY